MLESSAKDFEKTREYKNQVQQEYDISQAKLNRFFQRGVLSSFFPLALFGAGLFLAKTLLFTPIAAMTFGLIFCIYIIPAIKEYVTRSTLTKKIQQADMELATFKPQPFTDLTFSPQKKEEMEIEITKNKLFNQFSHFFKPLIETNSEQKIIENQKLSPLEPDQDNLQQNPMNFDF